jgi:hypothetical protein
METNQCQIHQKRMRKTLVRVHYGLYCPAKVRSEYKHAKHVVCMGCVVRGSRKIIALTYCCSKCNQSRRKDKEYWEKREKDL